MTNDLPLHVPVMMEEVLHWLAPQAGQIVVDGTLGGGGHTQALARRVIPEGLVIALDRDPQAIEAGARRLAGLPVRLAQANFCDLPEVLDTLQISAVDGVLLDLGWSSDQLADPQRGLSFDSEGPLDLRFDPTEGEPAWRLVNRLGEAALADILYQYGDERYSRRIARNVVAARQETPIRTARQLAEIVRRSIPRRPHREAIDPATRTFQALRIYVNHELRSLELALRRIPPRLQPGGRMAVLSYHSLEDRLVKEAFRDPTRFEALTKKPLRPTEAEIRRNPRCRSARLRVARRVGVS